jgi:hypothetical protein
MRAGRFDDSYGERADRIDWDGLFCACPALFRHFAAHLAPAFRHVLVDCRSGRSAAVSVCTTLLPDKLVGLVHARTRAAWTACRRVARAIEYRCSHEDEQRPLLVYPVPAAIDSRLRAAHRAGAAAIRTRACPARATSRAGKQLLRECYGLPSCRSTATSTKCSCPRPPSSA